MNDIRHILKLAGLSALSLAALVVVLAIIGLWVLSPETRQQALELITGRNADARAAWQTPAGKELIRANNEHYYLAYNIARCFNLDFAFGSRGPPATISIPFILGLQPRGDVEWDNTARRWHRLQRRASLKLTNYQRSILALSTAISSARTQSASTAADSDIARYILQLLIILVGAATTIFVSLKSIIKADTNASLVIGILAGARSALE
jgi:hypothetical protein